MDFYQKLAKYQISKKELRKLYWKWRILKKKEIKSQIINSFLPMALKIATKISEKFPNIELMELFNESYLIIDKALNYYNPAKAELSTFVYLMLKWNLKHFVFRQHAPVRYSTRMKQKMKEDGISFNPLYLSEVEDDFFVYRRTPEDILYEKEVRKRLSSFLKKHFGEIEKEGKVTKKMLKRLKSLSTLKEELNELLGL